MPNTGRPSRDCHLCRKRRVKCDLGRPGCERCRKYGTECPGYRDQHELVFRAENPHASRPQRKKRESKVAETGEAGLGRSLQASTPSSLNSFSLARSPSSAGDTDLLVDEEIYAKDGTASALETQALDVSLQRPSLFAVNEHWTSRSVPLLLHIYSSLGFLHNAYQTDLTSDSPLVLAAHLFSRTYVTNLQNPTSSRRSIDRELAPYLGKTLAGVSRALAQPGAAHRNDILATVWILANYELLIGSLVTVHKRSPWHVHISGLYSMLKARGKAQLFTEEGRTAFWPSFNIVQIQALISNTECPPETGEWLGIIAASVSPDEALMLPVSTFIMKAAKVIARVMAILAARDKEAAVSEFEGLASELLAAQHEITSFMTTTCDTEYDMYQRYTNNIHHSTIIKGFNCLLLLGNYRTHLVEGAAHHEQLRLHREYCLRLVRRSAQAILDSSLLALDTLKPTNRPKSPQDLFDALRAVWPLTAVYNMATTLPEQKIRAEQLLMLIGKEIGVRQALNTYSSLNIPPEAHRAKDNVKDASMEISLVGRLPGALLGHDAKAEQGQYG